MSDQRLIDIEFKLAHQEALIDELNAVVTKQQTTIDTLEAALKILAKRQRNPDEKPIGPANQKPPHY
ncbi:MAG: SlyX family protein [Bdellovibrionales bacterium]|nr:SlyX family protein [Bdellovibrionales bacterium]